MAITRAAIVSTTAIGPATINSTFSLIDSGFPANILLPPVSLVLLEGKYGAQAPKNDPSNGEFCYQLIG
jgi:hypothetical protein